MLLIEHEAENPGPGYDDEHAARPGNSSAASDPDCPGHHAEAVGQQEDATTPASPGQRDGDAQASPERAHDPQDTPDCEVVAADTRGRLAPHMDLAAVPVLAVSPPLAGWASGVPADAFSAWNGKGPS